MRLSPGCNCCSCTRDVTIAAANCLPAATGNLVQQIAITGSPTDGTFTLAWNADVTAPIAWNAAASDVQTALEALPSIGAGNAPCTGGPLPNSPVTVVFPGTLASIPLLVGNPAALKGGTNVAVTVETMPGNVPTDATATMVSDESQSITINGAPIGGTFTLSFKGSTTPAIPWYASNTDILQALQALPTIGPGNIIPGPAVFPHASGAVVTFIGTLAKQRQPLIVANTTDGNGNSLLITNGWELKILGTPTGGSLKLTFGTETTEQIPWDATDGEVQSALEALSSVGSGNVQCSAGDLPGKPVAIVFAADLAGIPLSIGDNSLTGDFHLVPTLTLGKGGVATVAVAELLQGGQTIGPVNIDPKTGVGDFGQVAPGRWEWTVSATDYLDATGTVDVACPPKTPSLNIGTTILTVVDGKIVRFGQPKPTAPPGSVGVTGDPSGLGSLSLVNCTQGTAVYVGTAGPNSVTIPCGPSPQCDPCTPLVVTRQSWTVTALGCQHGTFVVWTVSVPGIPALLSCLGAPIADCLPGGHPGNDACGFCQCTAEGWSLGNAALNSVPCGSHGQQVFVGSPSFGAVIGGGCISPGMVSSWDNPFVLVPGWIGEGVATQTAILWGSPVPTGNPCAFPLGIKSIPCITVTS